ncbi:histone-lysine N-methyltransferase SETDB2 isoform X5 [Lepus europaeus]|uniref:histone-lysine N-methyltransferase SETDB2 isoform X5 n=1 Tax=Lepus europaeus TaxID=9983 RepID=UPI002B45FF04|nr:histone-lysine N-methyltransferase SETDB2 isoform X5 [Lepus europaeus]
MAQASSFRPRLGGTSGSEVQGALPRPAEKMEKRRCALCPSDLDYSVLYFARSENIAAHENCLLFSSALVECEDHDPCNHGRNFDVESVKKEIHRGRRLKCTFCGERGATVGCDLKYCAKNYHFFCAKMDHAFPHTDEAQGIYKVFCKQHASESRTMAQSGMKTKRGRKRRLPADIHVPPPGTVMFPTLARQGKEESGRHPDAILKIDFIRKCKEAGLLDDLFEEMLNKLHLIRERLEDETASESEYEEIATSLFDCRLFEDTIIDFQAAIENKIDESEERQQQLNKETELLQELKQTMCYFQDYRDLGSSSTSVSSLSF